MTTQASDLMQAIGVYTDQIERYESMSTWFMAFHVVCLLVILALAGLLAIFREKGRNRALYTGLLSAVFLVVPVLATLYLYCFAMNMRKVALYRGYLRFLEQRWNTLTGLDAMLFNSEVMDRFFSFRSFLVNGLGPAVMAVFVLLALGLSLWLSVHFLRQLTSSKMKKGLGFLVGLTLAVCICFNGLCVYYLSTNDSIVASAAAYCEERATP